MTKVQMKIFIEGSENLEFLDSFTRNDPDFNGVKDDWNDQMRLYFAMVYLGWMLGMDEFDHSKYE